jgi:hypothetical protein
VIMRGGAGVDTRDLRRAEWRKSAHSGGNGSCVEVARNLPGIVAVRDSKNPDRPALVVTPTAWRGFTAQIKAGQFDLD